MWHSTHTTICFYINTEHTEVVAHENALFKVTLFITYGRDAGTNRFAPIQETTSFFGWSLGYEWKPFGPTVQIRGNDLSCTANGILEWKLLNNTVYSQFKSFSRTIELAE